MPGKLLTPGTVVADQFRIHDVLGEGGFAVVYLAEEIAANRFVALKVLEPVAASQRQAGFEARFLHEAHAAQRIDHPGVAKVYGCGICDQTGSPWIALEWLRGRDLATELTSRGPLMPSRALARMRELLAVLAVAHHKGIVHKDIKPSNLFLVNVASVAERVTLLDFGIARIFPDDALRSTATGKLLGTPHYLAPEYIHDLIVTPALDVYQCALVFAEMLIGRPVLANLDLIQAMSAHSGARLTLPAVLLDGPLGPIFRRALTPNHTDRYPDAAALAEALRQADAMLPAPLTEEDLAVVRPVSGTFDRPRPRVGLPPREHLTHETLTELHPQHFRADETGNIRPGPRVRSSVPMPPTGLLGCAPGSELGAAGGTVRRGAWGRPSTTELKRAMAPPGLPP